MRALPLIILCRVGCNTSIGTSSSLHKSLPVHPLRSLSIKTKADSVIDSVYSWLNAISIRFRDIKVKYATTVKKMNASFFGDGIFFWILYIHRLTCCYSHRKLPSRRRVGCYMFNSRSSWDFYNGIHLESSFNLVSIPSITSSPNNWKLEKHHHLKDKILEVDLFKE